MPRTWTSVFVGCLVTLLAISQFPACHTRDDVEVDKWELLYQRAMAIRAKHNASVKEQVMCIDELLVPAAGVHSRPTARKQSKSQVADDDVANSNSTSEQQAAAMSIPGYPELEVAARAHKGALRELAKALMEGWGCVADAQLALQLFILASDMGDAEAQGQMGVRYALGLHHNSSWDEQGIVMFGEPDEERAILHLYFAAMGGDMLARMALGYNHLYGLGVPKNCHTAASYYLPVAEQVADMAADQAGPGLPHIERIRLNVHHLSGAKADRQREVVQYYQDSADKGNVDAQTAVGQVLNYGTHGVERDHEAAMVYLQRAADAGDAQAMAHLANMLANGLGGDQPDYQTAFQHFQTAAAQNNAAAQYGLGYMYLSGQGATQNYDEAFKLFSQAAAQGHADAHFYLGVIHLRGLGGRRRNLQRAFTCFTLAAHAGNVQAMYNAALLHMAGKGTTKSCKAACALLKLSVERGPAAATLQQGHEAFFKGQYNQAVWYYLQAAVAGMELGMSNAAWLLSQGYTRAGGRVDNITFSLHQRSAAQGNIASLLAMGDAYFYGKGVEQEWSRSAAIYYEAYQELSPEAMFNLGFMHEFGAGVPKDLLLARRFYDMAKHTTADAALAAYCARTWLVFHHAWEAIRPFLPKAYDHIWDHIWSLRPPHTSVLGSWTAVVAQLLPSQAVVQLELGAWRWMDALGVTSLLSAVGETKDMGETAIMLTLMVLLYVVLRMRRQRVAQYQQRQQQQQQGEGQPAVAIQLEREQGTPDPVLQADGQVAAQHSQAGTSQTANLHGNNLDTSAVQQVVGSSSGATDGHVASSSSNDRTQQDAEGRAAEYDSRQMNGGQPQPQVQD